MVEMETYPTLADTCAGGVDLDSITLDLCRRYVDEIWLLTETEIEASIRLLFEQHRLVVEGSGALSVGGLLNEKNTSKERKWSQLFVGATFLWNCSNASLRKHKSTSCLR